MDSEQPAIDNVTIVCRTPEDNPALVGLDSMLRETGAGTRIVADVDIAIADVRNSDVATHAVLVDVTEAVIRRDLEAYKRVCADLEAIRAHVPHVAPIAIADSPPSMLVIAAFRTGAYDFIDLGAANKATVIQTLQRALRESHLRAERRIKLSELRALVDEFLRGLVKSEQRSLDLESQLRRATGEATAADSNDPEAPRPPRVLIVDDDQDVLDILEVDLQAAGAEVVLASSGEDALQKVSALGSDTPLDVLLIDGKMPGIDGLETIRRVRALRGAVPAMLMTGFSSAQSAINAADLGVVGYVVKPFDDIGELVGRVVAAGTRAVAERRERAYLLRIKHRHANLLFHYRKIAAQLERLE